MAKRESTFINMVTTLFEVTLISSTALGYVYELTRGPKAATDLKKKISAIKEVVPEFDNNPSQEQYKLNIEGGVIIFYPAKKDGVLVGTAIESFTNQGFGGTIRLMVGLLPDGSIFDTSVIEHKETPGLGDKIEKRKSDFSMQFKEKRVSGFKPRTITPGEQVNATTGATMPVEGQLNGFKLSVTKDGGDVDAITAATISSRAYCDVIRRAYAAYQKRVGQ